MLGIYNPGLELSFHLGKRRKSPMCLVSTGASATGFCGLNFCVTSSHTPGLFILNVNDINVSLKVHNYLRYGEY